MFIWKETDFSPQLASEESILIIRIDVTIHFFLKVIYPMNPARTNISYSLNTSESMCCNVRAEIFFDTCISNYVKNDIDLTSSASLTTFQNERIKIGTDPGQHKRLSSILTLSTLK